MFLQTFCVSSAGYNLCELLLEAGRVLLLLLFAGPLHIEPSPKGDDTLDRSAPTPE